MSFELECPSCGALSAPSIGACPYCKSIFPTSKKAGKENPQVSVIKKYYADGKIADALYMAKRLWDEKEKMRENSSFLTIFANILFEAEAYPALLNSILGRVALLGNIPPALAELKEILQAKELLAPGKNDLGERQLRALLNKNSKSAYAHFTLGTHLYFVENDIRDALLHLEAAAKNRPNFLRAWGCLGAIYKQLGKEQLASRAFKRAAKLETNKRMKDFFTAQASHR